MRALCLLPGGIGRFVPCSVGVDHCRLLILGGRSVVMDSFLGLARVLLRFSLNELLGLFRYPPWTGPCVACKFAAP